MTFCIPKKPLSRRTMLRGMGIDYAQGYGVSEPKRLLQAVA